MRDEIGLTLDESSYFRSFYYHHYYYDLSSRHTDFKTDSKGLGSLASESLTKDTLFSTMMRKNNLAFWNISPTTGCEFFLHPDGNTNA